MDTRKVARMRRAGKSRARIRRAAKNRLCVFRSPKHVYAQIIEPSGGRVLVSASTIEREIREQIGYGGNVGAAVAVGKRLAEKAKKCGHTPGWHSIDLVTSTTVGLRRWPMPRVRVDSSSDCLGCDQNMKKTDG